MELLLAWHLQWNVSRISAITRSLSSLLHTYFYVIKSDLSLYVIYACRLMLSLQWNSHDPFRQLIEMLGRRCAAPEPGSTVSIDLGTMRWRPGVVEENSGLLESINAFGTRFVRFWWSLLFKSIGFENYSYTSLFYFSEFRIFFDLCRDPFWAEQVKAKIQSKLATIHVGANCNDYVVSNGIDLFEFLATVFHREARVVSPEPRHSCTADHGCLLAESRWVGNLGRFWGWHSFFLNYCPICSFVFRIFVYLHLSWDEVPRWYTLGATDECQSS